MTAVEHWASIQSKLKAARKATLEAEGISEQQLRSLKADALGSVKADVTETKWGIVQRIQKGKVTWYPRASVIDSWPILNEQDLVLLTQDE